MEGNTPGAFDGVTIAQFDENNKIYNLKEFQSKRDHEYPYGINPNNS